jgi:hypothetical protein
MIAQIPNDISYCCIHVVGAVCDLLGPSPLAWEWRLHSLPLSVGKRLLSFSVPALLEPFDLKLGDISAQWWVRSTKMFKRMWEMWSSIWWCRVFILDGTLIFIFQLQFSTSIFPCVVTLIFEVTTDPEAKSRNWSCSRLWSLQFVDSSIFLWTDRPWVVPAHGQLP